MLNAAMTSTAILKKQRMLWDIIVILIALLFEFMDSGERVTPCEEWSAELATYIANKLQYDKTYRVRQNRDVPGIWKSSKRRSYRNKDYYL